MLLRVTRFVGEALPLDPLAVTLAVVKNLERPPLGRSVAELPPLAVRVKEACRLTGMGRSKLYLLIRDGHIETVKIGSMTLIPLKCLERLVRTGTEY